MIVIFCIIIITIVILVASFYSYTIAFRAPRRSDFTEYELPKGSQYEEYYPTIRRSADEMIAIPYKEICITSFDHLNLFGRYYHVSDNAPIHLMMHGYKSNPYIDFSGGSRFALTLGHNVIVVDQRAHGKSEGETISFGINERKDCLSWINYINKNFGKDTPVFLWGLSMGAATVLMANDLNLPENISGIIADCPFSSPKEIIKKVSKDMGFPPALVYPFILSGAYLFGHFNLEESSAVEAVKCSNLPILLFHGDDDRFVPYEMSIKIRESNPERVTLVIVPKAGHGLCYMVEPEQYQDSITAFINKHLKR